MRIKSKKLRVAIRIVLPIFYICLIALMFVLGRTHTVLFENKNSKDGSFDGFDIIEVSFNDGKPIELFSGDRDKILLRGQKHKVRVQFADGSEDFTGEFKIKLFSDSVLVSIPGLVKKHPKAVQDFDIYAGEVK